MPGDLTANTARTHLLIDGQPLPWSDWAVELRENIPEPIKNLIDTVAGGAATAENANSIRERLRQVRDLFRFSRYRPSPDGKHMIDGTFANTGGSADEGNAFADGGSGGQSRRRPGRAGDLYSLLADNGDIPADEVGGIADPVVKWVSVKDGSRTDDFLEDRAAKFLPQANTIQANADFRVFTDMVVRWQKSYVRLIRFGGHLPKGEYDGHHDGVQGSTDTAELHRGLQSRSRPARAGRGEDGRRRGA